MRPPAARRMRGGGRTGPPSDRAAATVVTEKRGGRGGNRCPLLYQPSGGSIMRTLGRGRHAATRQASAPRGGRAQAERNLGFAKRRPIPADMRWTFQNLVAVGSPELTVSMCVHRWNGRPTMTRSLSTRRNTNLTGLQQNRVSQTRHCRSPCLGFSRTRQAARCTFFFFFRACWRLPARASDGLQQGKTRHTKQHTLGHPPITGHSRPPANLNGSPG